MAILQAIPIQEELREGQQWAMSGQRIGQSEAVDQFAARSLLQGLRQYSLLQGPEAKVLGGLPREASRLFEGPPYGRLSDELR